VTATWVDGAAEVKSDGMWRTGERQTSRDERRSRVTKATNNGVTCVHMRTLVLILVLGNEGEWLERDTATTRGSNKAKGVTQQMNQSHDMYSSYRLTPMCVCVCALSSDPSA
jgi:hypothetical protein